MKTDGSYIPRVEPNPDRKKRCTTCGDWWPIDCFQRDRYNPDLHRNQCKACRAERRRELKWQTNRYHRRLHVCASMHRGSPQYRETLCGRSARKYPSVDKAQAAMIREAGEAVCVECLRKL